MSYFDDVIEPKIIKGTYYTKQRSAKMSNYQPKEGSLSLFKNDKKSSPNAPDWRGNGLFMGKKVKIAAWEKETSKGDTFFSLKIEEDIYQAKSDTKSIAAVHGGAVDDDPIPFAKISNNLIFNV